MKEGKIMAKNTKQELQKVELTLTTQECTILYSAVANMYEKYYKQYKHADNKEAEDFWLDLAIRTWMMFVEIVRQTTTEEV